MSGVDAAATLSLRIDTDKARKDIGELRAEYRQLRQELGSDLKVGTIGNQIKDLQASLSAVGAGVLSVNKALDDIVRAGGKFTNSLVVGAKEAVKQNSLLTDSYTTVSAAASKAGKSAVQYNSLMGTTVAASMAKSNALLTESYTSVSVAASKAANSAVQYNSLMGTAAPVVAAMAKSNALLTESYTTVSATAAAAGKSVVQYNSLMGTAAPVVAAMAKSNALLTESLVSVAKATSVASKSVVEYDALMGASSPLVVGLSKSNNSLATSNALLTQSYITVASSTNTAGKAAVAYDSLMMAAAQTSAKAVASNALLTDSYTSVARAVSAATKSVVTYNSMLGATSASAAKVRDNSLLTDSITRSATARQPVVSTTRIDPLLNSVPSSEPEDSHRRLSNAIKETTASQINWNKAAHEGHSAVRGLSGSLGTLWITYGSLVPLLTGAALGAAFKQTAVAGAEFAYQLTFVKALGGETAETVERLSNAAKSLGQNSLQGPVELASGFRVLAQAGVKGSDAILAMSSVLDLAVTGEMDMAQAGTTLVGVMNAFNLTVSNASHVGDVFAKAAALSQTSVQAMTESMKTASVVGEQYGASLEDTATALTLLAKVNITGTAAGTSLRNMLKELYSPTKQAADTFAQLGLKTAEANGNLKTFPDIIFELRGILEQYDKTSQVNILQRLFGERGAKEAIAMLAETRDSWDKLNAKISQSSGFMREVSAELEATTKGSFQQAINALKTGFVDAFSKTEGPMKDMAIRLKSLFSSEGFRDGIVSAVALLGNMASGLLSVASAIVSVANALPQGTGTFIGMALAAGGTTLALTSLVSRLAATATSLSALGAAGLAALSPLAPLYIAVGGLTAAYVLFNSKTPDTINGIDSVNAALGTQITRLKLVNDELRKKIGLESTNASVEASAVRRSIDASKAKLSEYDSALRSDEESKRSGSTTVLGDMARSVFSTDDEYRKKQAFLIEARVNRTALAKKIQQAEVELKVAEGYADEIRINSAKAQVKDLLAQQEAESKLKTGKDKFVPTEGGTKAGSNRGDPKDYRSILNDNLASGLKQEQIQLARELIEIETQVAAQVISTVEAIRQKNQATEESIEIERLWIEASLADAKVANDRVAVAKFQNDLDENTVKMEKQKQQALLDNTKAYTAEQNAIQNIGIATSRYIEDLELERIALDMTAAQVAQLRIEREALRATEDLNLKVSRRQIEPEEATAAQVAIDARANAQKQDDEYRRSYVGGWKKAYKDWADNATDAAKQAADSFAIMSTAMDRALDEFLSTGKLNFADFAKSVILEIAKIEAKALVAKATAGTGGFGGIISSILGMFGGGGGGFSASDFANLAGSFIDSAKGNVFSGSPSLHQYANTVQSTPKTFAFQNLHGFAKGGVFAEAGPEAVMPLARDNMGRLGVRAQTDGGDGGNVFNITVNVNGNANAQDVRRSAGQGTREALAALNGARRYA